MWAQEAACRLWGHGDHPLPFVLVEDVADGLIRALDAEGVDGESFNLVGPPVLSGRDYVAELSRAAGVAVDVAPTAPWRFYAADMAKWAAKVLVRHPDGRRVPSYREWESRTLRAPFDFGKARERLGWVPTSDRDEYIRRGIVLPATEYHS